MGNDPFFSCVIDWWVCRSKRIGERGRRKKRKRENRESGRRAQFFSACGKKSVWGFRVWSGVDMKGPWNITKSWQRRDWTEVGSARKRAFCFGRSWVHLTDGGSFCPCESSATEPNLAMHPSWDSLHFVSCQRQNLQTLQCTIKPVTIPGTPWVHTGGDRGVCVCVFPYGVKCASAHQMIVTGNV